MSENKSYLLFIALVSALGGFLFGYDWVVIGGAKPFYEVYFNIVNSPSMQGWVMGSAILGCLLGVMVSGTLSDRYGRKPLMIVAAILFTASAIGTGAANSIEMFIVWRVVGGIGIGIASNLSPMYIAEIAPSATRGKYVSINQLTIVIGILAAQITNLLVAEPIDSGNILLNSWNVQSGWRVMFWAEAVPSVAFFLLILIIPESPRWLASQYRFEKAITIFSKIGGQEFALDQVNELKKTLGAVKETVGFKMLLEGKMPKILLLGIFIAVFQQWCGINVIFNYAQEIFSAAGYGVSDILFNIVITGLTNLIFTYVGMLLVDRLGRRVLMLFGSIGLAGIYILLGLCYFYSITGPVVLILVIAAIACYAMTLAPVTWVVLSEIFPVKIRAMAMGVATFSLWAACFVLTYSFPILNKSLGANGTFWLYGFVCFIGYLFLRIYLTETKGKSLEQIETELTK
ncbi:sugar porter family MFS transporter [Flavobacterium daejeonense]|uniref:sugar porter family MFS transporter n=1 Tax=Flavobacterium daejeonense TaxID=350893 RepID=UPI000479F560|nr:sugar porter family MFS transporter [Flavobacterium daejeonense]